MAATKRTYDPRSNDHLLQAIYEATCELSETADFMMDRPTRVGIYQQIREIRNAHRALQVRLVPQEGS